jgi:hypothetical protein
MTTLREAIEQTVAILGPEAPLCSGCVDEWTEALRILRAALAEPEPDPVTYNGWVLREVYFDEEGNPTMHREPPKAEPVAWVRPCEQELSPGDAFSWVETALHTMPLYTAPQPAKREPLTDDEISDLWLASISGPLTATKFVRAIERAHGIGDQE